MKKITRLFLFLALAVAILAPVTVQFNNSLDNGRQIADGGGGGPIPPFPGC